MVNVEGLHEAKNNGGKSLIQLIDVNVRHVHACAFKGFLRRKLRACQHDRRLRTDRGHRADARAWLKAKALACFFITDEDRACTVYNT